MNVMHHVQASLAESALYLLSLVANHTKFNHYMCIHMCCLSFPSSTVISIMCCRHNHSVDLDILHIFLLHIDPACYITSIVYNYMSALHEQILAHVSSLGVEVDAMSD